MTKDIMEVPKLKHTGKATMSINSYFSVTVDKLIEVMMDLVEEDKVAYVCGFFCPQPSLMLSMSFQGYVDCHQREMQYKEKQCGK